jgi:SH3-like domain-containing protein
MHAARDRLSMLHIFENTTNAPVRVFVFTACFLGSSISAGASESLVTSSYKTIVKILGLGKANRSSASIILRSDQQPFILHQFPSDQSDIVASLNASNPETRHVQVLTGCDNGWCHVRIGSAVGWIESIKLEIPNVPGEQIEFVDGPLGTPEQIEQPQHAAAEHEQVAAVLEAPPSKPEPAEIVSVPIPNRKKAFLPDQEQPKLKSEPEQAPITTASLPLRDVVEPNTIDAQDGESIEAKPKLTNIARKKYSLSLVEDITFIPVREDPLNEESIVGAIPFFANNIEALGVCIGDWCLIKRGENLLGWIQREYLSDTRQGDAPQLKLQNTAKQKVIPLYRGADREAEIAAYIDPRANGISPVGEICNQDWCLIRHDGEFGWIESKYIARQ